MRGIFPESPLCDQKEFLPILSETVKKTLPGILRGNQHTSGKKRQKFYI
jgi:hypothetical protein